MFEVLQQFHFIRPAWLCLIPVAILVWWLWQRNSDALQGWRSQIDSELLTPMIVGENDAQARWKSWALLVVWLLAITAVAGPTWRLEPNPFAADAQPLLVLLKADESMRGTPPMPSRMERARLKIADLANVRAGQPLGLIAYAGSSHLVLPPTRDTKVVAEMAAEISPDVMPKPGDRLDLAIGHAIDLLAEQQQGGAILVITDTAEINENDLLTIEKRPASFPILFLSIVGEESPEADSVAKAASLLSASLQTMTVDDQDIQSIIDYAARGVGVGKAGESSRWQESGYWLTPLIAVIVAFSFRRQERTAQEQTSEGAMR
ncbi:vWA domain-containing protein [Roseiconus lacunae]|uniref:vWA domain-containing protein n=1 Tax=Roseiconus lacunae TaxID=2605694 RepID=UPI0011F3F97D|nr:VWA domain-containing protein [Roseiconus lacunae]